LTVKNDEGANNTIRLIYTVIGIAVVSVLLLLLAQSRELGKESPEITRSEVSPSPPPVTRPQRKSLCGLLPKVVARAGETEIIREDICELAAPVTNVESGGGFTEEEEQFFRENAWIMANMKVKQMVLRLEVQHQGLELTDSDLIKDVVWGGSVKFGVLMHIPGFREHLLSEKLREREITDKVQVTEAEIEAFYESSKTNYLHPFRYTLRRILFRSPSKEQLEQARIALWRDSTHEHAEELRRLETEDKLAHEQARALVAKLSTKDADFAAIAAAYGDAPERENGGLLGTFESGKLPRQYNLLQRRVLDPKGTRVTPPIATDEGYEIIMVDSIEPRRQMSLEEVRPEIVRRLKYEKGQSRETEWMEELVKKWGGEVFIPKPEGIDRSSSLK
jgi:hypothetical protein